MNAFDASLLHFFNEFAHRSWALDYFVVWLTRDEFQKGGIVALLLWWAWFWSGEKVERVREIVVSMSFAAPAAFLLSRLLSQLVPFRARPIHQPELGLRLAYTLSPDTLMNWSAFPSDHAALFFTYVTGLFLISRRLGWVALTQVSFIICLPRVYLGIHSPSDIVAGALIGFGMAWLFCRPAARRVLAGPILNWAKLHTALFYVGFFVYTCQVADSFGWVRDVLVLVRNLSLSHGE